MRRFTTGDPLEFRRYMLVVTPRAMERERVSFNLFDEYTSDFLLDLGAPPRTADYPGYLDSLPRGKVALLAELRKDPGILSVLQGTRFPSPRRAEDRPLYLLSTATLILLRGKALTLNVYTMYDSQADIDWIRATTSRWIDEIRRLNSR